MTVLERGSVKVIRGSGYPAPYDQPCLDRENTPLGAAAGLTQFGVNLTRVPPGTWSSQRHWHTHEDEFVYVMEGKVVLVTDTGREVLSAGDGVGFPAGHPNGHHFINEGDRDVLLLTIGACSDADTCHYSDTDLHLNPGRYSDGDHFTRKDGSPYRPDTE